MPVFRPGLWSSPVDALVFACAVWVATGPPQYDPPPQDLLLFPGWRECCVACDFAGCHVAWVERQVDMDPWQADEWHEWLVEARFCRACWWTLRDAHSQGVTRWRCEYLATLRDTLGRERYAAGLMCPPAPVWRFAWAD